mgnify:CR=1 FL=1
MCVYYAAAACDSDARTGGGKGIGGFNRAVFRLYYNKGALALHIEKEKTAVSNRDRAASRSLELPLECSAGSGAVRRYVSSAYDYRSVLNQNMINGSGLFAPYYLLVVRAETYQVGSPCRGSEKDGTYGRR